MSTATREEEAEPGLNPSLSHTQTILETSLTQVFFRGVLFNLKIFGALRPSLCDRLAQCHCGVRTYFVWFLSL